jgi:hypothetical protein
MLPARSNRLVVATSAGLALLLAGAIALTAPVLSAQTDLDAFMKQVMERRDDNWKKLQQYILDEREELDVRGPGGFPIWGERGEYTWYIRDGFFIRSPLKMNGVTISEADRRKYEEDYLRRAQNREMRQQAREDERAAGKGSAPGIEGLIQDARQPEFVSSAYFLRFKFDAGRYALVGREQFEKQDVLRVEYYPTKLFSDDEEEERRRRRQERDRDGADPANDKAVGETVNRLLNKGSRITLWIEPGAKQIVKYTFDNVDMDFFPARWLASVTGGHASMTMGQPFPDVWLPRETIFTVGLIAAIGEVSFRGTVSYHDYRRADVTTGLRVPGAR